LDILPKWNEPAIRVLMMPRDTNAHGTIFGGVILSYVDQAGAIEARRQGSNMMVTVSMDKIVFHAPVFVGDLVSFWTETLRIGTSSITTKITVKAVHAGQSAFAERPPAASPSSLFALCSLRWFRSRSSRSPISASRPECFGS